VERGSEAVAGEGRREGGGEGARGRLRVGVVGYLNSRPLAWSLVRGAASELVAPVFLPPSAVADRLARGELDVGLVPSVELQRIPGLGVVPGLCIASEREVASVLLVSRRPLGELRRVALDTSSRTSAVLVQILAAERWGIAPEYVPLPPDLDAMLEDSDAALLIGDAALAVDRSRFRVVDLAAEWRALTGLPFVFAVWAVAGGDAPEGLVEALRESLEQGLAHLGEIVAAAADESGLPAATLEAYFTRHLSYRLGDEERASLDELFHRAARWGLLPEPRPLRFLSG
jgi:chorismate dehydratase